MPKLIPDDDMMVSQIPGGGSFQFSGIRPEKLGATEYTLATIAIDITGSVQSFAKQLLEMNKKIIEACNSKRNPRRENLLVRVTKFNGRIGVEEVHILDDFGFIIGDEDKKENK